MSNPIFNQMGNRGNNQFANMINQFSKFKANFNGDPKQAVQELLNSGRMTQEQFNQLQYAASQLKNILK